ncbi:MAG TPA: dipeptidase [Gemmatimonadaceae bacterium]|nr:dipeptidase [Gemmatimonadaceae bacterium]
MLAIPLAALLALTATPHPAHAQHQDSLARIAHARAILRAAPLIDGHNDLPWRIREDSVHPMDVDAYDLRQHTPGMTDLERLRQGGVGAQFWSVYIPGEPEDPTYRHDSASVSSAPGYARAQLEQIDIARRVIARYPDQLALALSADDIVRITKEGKIASLIGMEGGHAIENSLAALRMYYALGARYMTLTHNVTLDWADAALDSAKRGGLTPFGVQVVHEMNRLGMLVDLSHTAPGTMSDALTASRAPVIFSHSGARALVDHPRNVPDSILRRVRTNGGIVMVPFVPEFVSAALYRWEQDSSATADSAHARHAADSAAATREIAAWVTAHAKPHATIAEVADHIEHVRDVAGVEHVGIGSDFDGITLTVQGLEDVSKFPALFAELIRRGWSDADLKKLAGQNLLRVFRDAERVAAELRGSAPAASSLTP